MPGSAGAGAVTAELKAVNERLWQIEDEIRRCERDEDFGPRFVALARVGVSHQRSACRPQTPDQ